VAVGTHIDIPRSDLLGAGEPTEAEALLRTRLGARL
jgi:hypothetical protein